MAPSATAGNTKRASMPQQRKAAAPAKETAASTTPNPTDEVPSQSMGFDHFAAMQRVNGSLVVYVAVSETATGRISRRVFLSLDAAETAVLRAWDRGHPAEVVIGTLTALNVGGDL